MKWFSKAAVGGLLWLAFSIAAFGDTLYITGQSYNIDQGGQFTAYLGSNPAQTLLIYCVDYRNFEASPRPVNISTPLSMADISNARYGTTTGATVSTFNEVTPVPPTAVDRYTMAAWLTTQYILAPSPTQAITNRNVSIQGAIWELLDVNARAFSDGGAEATWIANAKAWEAGLSSSALSAFESKVRIYTSTDVGTNNDLNQADAGNRYDSGTQEMIGITPEPETFAMLGAGLLAIGLVRKRISG